MCLSYVAEENYDEAKHYLAELAPARGISEVVWRDALDTLMTAIQFPLATDTG